MDHGLAVLLDKLDDVNYECIAKTIESMAEYTKKQYTQSVWKCFYVRIKELKKLQEKNNLKNIYFILLQDCNRQIH